MSDPDLLHQLGQRAREQDELAADPRWEERARGARGVAEPHAEAASAVVEVMREATEPAGEADLDAITDHVFATLSPAEAPARAVVVPLRRRRGAMGALAGALALAAGLALFLRAPGLAPVSEYDLDVGRGRSSDRNTPAPSATPRFGRTTEIEIVARPHEAVSGAVAVRGALVRGHETRAFEPAFQVTPEGAIRITGTRDVVFAGAPDGEWELWLAVGRREALPAQLPPAGPVDAKVVKILRAKLSLVP